MRRYTASLLRFCAALAAVFALACLVRPGEVVAGEVWTDLRSAHVPSWHSQWVKFPARKAVDMVISQETLDANDYLVIRVFGEDVDGFDKAYFRVNDSPVRYAFVGLSDQVVEQRLAVHTKHFVAGENRLTFFNQGTGGAIRVVKLKLMEQRNISRNELMACATGVTSSGAPIPWEFSQAQALAPAPPPEAPVAVQPAPVPAQSAQPSAMQPLNERRVALVIGNAGYATAPLRNPVNDARAMAAALKGLGFETELLTDTDQRGMEDAIGRFGERLRQADVGLFFFAGHGMQIDGRNYLVPVGANVRSESDVRYEAVDAGRVLGKMEEAGNRVNIVLLDACRDNPFARSFRSAQRGLARMDAPTGSIVGYATAPGNVAADGDGANGLYTAALLRQMNRPGLTIYQVLMNARVEVAGATGRSQVPWESSSLMGDFYFVPGAQGTDAESRPPEVASVAPPARVDVAPATYVSPPANKERAEFLGALNGEWLASYQSRGTPHEYRVFISARGDSIAEVTVQQDSDEPKRVAEFKLTDQALTFDSLLSSRSSKLRYVFRMAEGEVAGSCYVGTAVVPVKVRKVR